MRISHGLLLQTLLVTACLSLSHDENEAELQGAWESPPPLRDVVPAGSPVRQEDGSGCEGGGFRKDCAFCEVNDGSCVDAIVEAHLVKTVNIVTATYSIFRREESPSACGGDDTQVLDEGLGQAVSRERDHVGGCTVVLAVDGTPVHNEMAAEFEASVKSVDLHMGSTFSTGLHTLSLAVRDGHGRRIGGDETTFDWNANFLKPMQAMERALSHMATFFESEGNGEEGRGEVRGEGEGGEGAGEGRTGRVGRGSSVKKLMFEGLECSTPRATMRVYEVRKAETSEGRLLMLVGGNATAGMDEELEVLQASRPIVSHVERVAPLAILVERHVPFSDAEWCNDGGGSGTALMLPALGLGTVENFAHFLWDYLLNIHRLVIASGSVPGVEGCCSVFLHVSSIEHLLEHRPRRYYDMISAVTGKANPAWETIAQRGEGACFQRVIFGFGDLPSKMQC